MAPYSYYRPQFNESQALTFKYIMMEVILSICVTVPLKLVKLKGVTIGWIVIFSIMTFPSTEKNLKVKPSCASCE